MPKKIILVAGQKFGRLEFIKDAGYSTKKKPLIEVKCECDGKVIICDKGNVTSGHIVSCGCRKLEILKKQQKKKHGHSLSENGKATKEYDAWRAMKKRCLDPKNDSYERYGARGITICEQWLTSFITFLADVGEAPTKEHSIDRINNEGNYEPGNVKWSTAEEQANNRRNNHNITIGTETKNIKQWAKVYGIDNNLAGERLRAGWSVERTFTEPVNDNWTIENYKARKKEEDKT